MEARLGPLRVVGFRRDLGTPVRGTLLGRPGQMGSPLGGQGQAWEGEEGWWVCQEKCPLAGGAKGTGGSGAALGLVQRRGKKAVLRGLT